MQISCTATNITKTKRDSDTHANMQESLEHKIATKKKRTHKQQFAATMTHPLTPRQQALHMYLKKYTNMD
jgi:hypothetical protein